MTQCSCQYDSKLNELNKDLLKLQDEFDRVSREYEAAGEYAPVIQTNCAISLNSLSMLIKDQEKMIIAHKDSKVTVRQFNYTLETLETGFRLTSVDYPICTVFGENVTEGERKLAGAIRLYILHHRDTRGDYVEPQSVLVKVESYTNNERIRRRTV